MRTTFTLEDKRAEALISATRTKNLPQALNKLVSDWDQKQKLEDLFAMAGKVKFRHTWQEVKAINRGREERLFGKSTD